MVTNTATGCQNTSAAVAVSLNPLPTATITAAAATSICQGTTVALNANTGTGLSYVWNLNGTAITPAATAASYNAGIAGSYTVTVTNTATGCFLTSPATAVTVNALPSVVVSSVGNLNMCQGSTVTLSVPTATGQTYQWKLNGVNIVAATSASYVANAAGTYTVLVTNTATTCNATSANVVVTVSAVPIATITPVASTTACQGDTVWLNANTGTGLSYQWNLNGTPIAGAINATYPALAAGTYTTTVTNGAGCSTTSSQVNVTINPRPLSSISYTTPVTFCQGGAVVLTAVSSSGVRYQWNNNAVQMVGDTINFYIANVSGSYSVTTTNSLGCSATSLPILVVVNPLPLPVITRAGDLLTTGSYATYQWYFNSQPIAGANGQSYNVTKNGGYAVRVTDVNGCTNYSTVYFFNNVGVGQTSMPVVKVYPNPVHSTVNVESPVRVNLCIRDVTGRVVMNVYNAKQVDMSELADGAYLLLISDLEGRLLKTEKLTKAAE
jgi:hypothetical protein